MGSIPPAIGNLRDLRVLDLRNCGLTGEVPAELGQLSQWVTLNLSTNPKLGGVLPVGLAKTQNLRFLAFDGTQIFEPKELQGWLWLMYRSAGSVAPA